MIFIHQVFWGAGSGGRNTGAIPVAYITKPHAAPHVTDFFLVGQQNEYIVHKRVHYRALQRSGFRIFIFNTHVIVHGVGATRAEH